MTTIAKGWGWVLTLGILMTVIGLIAIGTPIVTSVATALLFGWLLLIGGIARIFQSFSWLRGWDTFAGVLSGFLAGLVGLFIVLDPVGGMIGLTLALGLLFLGIGVVQTMSATALRPQPGWGWALFHGIVTLVLGLMMTFQWPFSGLWVIGLFVGIELLLQGSRCMVVALAARSLASGAGAVDDITGLAARPRKEKRDTA